MRIEAKKGLAIYTIQYSPARLLMFLPKKRGIGWVLHPFGGHYANELYERFRDKTSHIVGEIVDCDGFVEINAKYHTQKRLSSIHDAAGSRIETDKWANEIIAILQSLTEDRISSFDRVSYRDYWDTVIGR